MSWTTFSGSNAGNRAFQANAEWLGGVVVSGANGFGGLPAFTGSATGAPVGYHRKYALSRSFADADATGSVIQALNHLAAIAGVDSAISSSDGATLGNLILNASTTSLKLSGTLSSSGGITTVGGIIANTVEVSSSIMTAGALGVTGTLTAGGAISGTAGISGHTLAVQAGSTLTGALVQHGGTTLQGQLSSSGGAVFLGTVITNTVEVSSSVLVAGRLTVTGTISSSAEGGFHTLKSQAGATFTGSLVQHGGTTLQGELSSSGGAVFLGTVIAKTVEVSSSVLVAGALGVTGTLTAGGAISGTAGISGHSLAIQAGATLTGSLINHGSVTIRNGDLHFESPGIEGVTDEAKLRISGTIYNEEGGDIVELGDVAAIISLDTIPYMEQMGTDADGKLRNYKFQVSGGMLQINQG